MSSSFSPAVAYFSMEICLEESIPTYSGGLGVLAGDTLRSAADLGVPLVAVTLAHRRGYFRQQIDSAGRQSELPDEWCPEDRLPAVAATTTVRIAGREVRVRAWEYRVVGVTGHVVPVYLLDTAVPENGEWDRTLTDNLYGGDDYYRLCQEVVLGIGGAQLLHALGIDEGVQHHMNEGHAALLALALLERQLDGRPGSETSVGDIEAVARRCLFTTHTPVPAGHDKFPADMARGVLDEQKVAILDAASLWSLETLNMTRLALRCSRFINAVARRHQEVSAEMFPDYPIGAITNGVHAVTWTSEPLRALYDRYLPEWRRDNDYLRYASAVIPVAALRDAHQAAKQRLVDEVRGVTGVALDPCAFTLGFARRATPYKRMDLLFTDLERLRAVVRRTGPLQVIFAGKAHPRDIAGKGMIEKVYQAAQDLDGALRVVFVPGYDMRLGGLMTAGVDVWLNTPMRPLEASGTSGMKAALNGVPSLSVLDGWWVEGCVEGVTGWAVGADATLPQDPSCDARALYDKLEYSVIPLFYGMPYRFGEIMRNAIGLNGSFFNTQRMVAQYVRNAYAPGGSAPATYTLDITAQ